MHNLIIGNDFKFHNVFTSVRLMMNIWPLDHSSSQQNCGLSIDNYKKSATHREENWCLLTWVIFLSYSILYFLSHIMVFFSCLCLTTFSVNQLFLPFSPWANFRSSPPLCAISLSVAFNRFNNDGLVQGDILQKVAPSCKSHHLFPVYRPANLPPCKIYPLFYHAGGKMENSSSAVVQCHVSNERLKTSHLTISYK